MNPDDVTCTPETFRSAMRRLASSVAVITSYGPDGPVGITATSAVSVSMSPPSFLICVNMATRLHEAVRRTKLFRINYLAQNQEDVARAFGGAFDGNRFSCGEWVTDAPYGPQLGGALCTFSCMLSENTDFGTHTVFIGTVAAAALGGHDPLLYCNGNFSRVPQIRVA